MQMKEDRFKLGFDGFIPYLKVKSHKRKGYDERGIEQMKNFLK